MIDPSSRSQPPTHATIPLAQPQPLVAAAIAFILGIILAMRVSWSATVSLGAAAIAWIIWMAGMYVAGKTARIGRQIALAAAIAAAGMSVWQINQQQVSTDNIARYLPPHGRALIRARMLIINAPKFTRPSPHRAMYSATGPATTFIARLYAAHTHGTWNAVTGDIIARVPGYLPALENNQRITMTGWISRPPRAVNPGAFDYRHYLKTYRIYAAIHVQHARQVRIISRHQSVFPLAGWIDAARQTLRQRLLAAQGGHGDAAFSNIALLLGYRDPSIRRVARHFSESGAAHLLALSGLHVVIIAGAIWLLLRMVIRRPRQRALAAMLVIIAYMLATPCGPPVVRATVAIVMVFITMLLGWPVQILNIVAAAAILVLIWTPAAITGVPFELSFAVTLGLIVLAGRFQRAVFGPWLQRQGDIARAINSRWSHTSLQAKHWVCGVITANLIGSIVAVPLTMYQFNQITPLAVVNGLILLPMVSLALVAGLFELLAVLVWQPLAAFLANLFYPVVSTMIWMVRQLAAVPGSVINVRPPPWWCLLICYAAIGLWMLRRRLRISRSRIVLCGTAAIGIMTGWYAITQPHNSVDIWVPSVGSGNAAIITGPQGQAIAINCGSLGSPHFLVGQVASLLHAHGIEHLDACFAGRIDPAHASSIGLLAERFGKPPIFCDHWDDQFQGAATGRKRFFASLTSLNLSTQSLSAGEKLHIGKVIRCRVLWPPDSLPEKTPAVMHGCIFLFSAWHRQHILFLDRTQNPALIQMLSRHGLRARIVILTGPGHVRSTMLRAIETLHPQTLVLSGEIASAYREDQRILKHSGLRYYQVRHCGCVHLTIEPDTMKIQPFQAFE